MRKYVLYGHDGSENHGCEALARTTTELLNQKNNQVILVSAKPEQDLKYQIDAMCSVVQRGQKAAEIRKDISFLQAYYALKVKHNGFPMEVLSETQAINVNQGDVALAIGGDSYCYSDNIRKNLFHQHRVFQSAGLKTVFWGCSFEAELLENKAVAEDIRKFDLITARETISYEMLKKVNPNTMLVADSAFLLEAESLPLPAGFDGADLVGINTSPLVERRESNPGIARKNFERLIETILRDTDYKIMLIPHVIWQHNDDRAVLRELAENYKETRRVALIEDHNCRELKGYISRCRFFIGARTHATIAAYSTGIPTLVLGYSTKSRGIANDLFGTDENYVLPVQQLRDENELVRSWDWLQTNEDAMRKRLQTVLPDYIKRIYEGQKAVMQLE